MAKPKAPQTLAKAGTDLWSSITSKYDLRPDELATLADACALADIVGALEAKWVELGRPLITEGSTGQQVTHPLVSEMRAQRMAHSALLKSLKLPDDTGKGAEDRSTQARAAAQARWSRRGA